MWIVGRTVIRKVADHVHWPEAINFLKELVLFVTDSYEVKRGGIASGTNDLSTAPWMVRNNRPTYVNVAA
jgi:hypothetical protein